MKDRLKVCCLWLLVINLGIACGAGLYEARVVVPSWFDIPPQSWPNTGLLFWVYITTVPLTLITLANLYLAWKDRSPRRVWWLRATLVIALERLCTFSYFIPTMVMLMRGDMPQPALENTLAQWLLFNHGRHLLVFSGWLLAIKTLSLGAGTAGKRAAARPGECEAAAAGSPS